MPPAASPTLLRRLDALLTPRRVCVAGALILAVQLLAFAAAMIAAGDGLDIFGHPVGGDFIIFYGASKLTLAGAPLAAFDPAALLEAQRLAVPGVQPGLEWAYPPPFQLLTAPLALLPYGIAYGVWTALTLASYLWVVRSIAPSPWGLVLACAFPAVLANATAGQNGFLTVTLLGGGLLLLDRRPWLAGMLLGLLIYKPQFGLLLPLLLAVGGRWRSIGSAAVTSLAAAGLAGGLLGWDLWAAFFHALPSVSASVAQGVLPLAKVPTIAGALILAGAPPAAALAVHLAVALPVVALTAGAWRRPGPLPLKAGLAILATLLTTPYAFNYDLVLLAVPLAAAGWYATRGGAPEGLVAALAVVFFAPGVTLSLAQATGVQLMPLATLLAFAALWRLQRLSEPAMVPAMKPPPSTRLGAAGS